MSKEVVLMFSGQGAQKVGMGKDLYEAHAEVREMFARANEILGFDLTQVMFGGSIEELTRTSRCQPALYLHGLAVLKVLQAQVSSIKVVAAAGLSLGEFTAHAAAGTFDFETGLKLVFQRGSFMEEACEKAKGGMAALISGEESAVRELAAENDVDVANFNSPGQIVISGTVEGIKNAVAKAKDKGIRKAVELQVAGAYHSRLMQSAQDQLATVLAGTAIQMPRVPVVSNYAARAVESPDDIRATLEKQVTGSVRWVESMQSLLAQGHSLFLELGPGGVLAGFLGRIQKGTAVHSIEDQKSLDAAVAALS